LLVKVLPAAGLLAVVYLVYYVDKQASPNRDDAKLKELQQLSSDLPVPAGFSGVSTHTSSRGMDAGVYKTYRSEVGYDEVKRFYADMLQPRGWVLSREQTRESLLMKSVGRDLEFRKGDMRISIEYTGTKAGDSSWNYAVNYLWDNHR